MESGLAITRDPKEAAAATPRTRALLGLLGLAAWVLVYQHLADAARWLTYVEPVPFHPNLS
jgi:hypothetical protein